MSFDPVIATARYIDSLGGTALQKAAAYTAGNHWVLLWELLIGAVVAICLVRFGVLEKVEAKVHRKGQFVQAVTVSGSYFLLSALVTLPWTIYINWWRELSYGRTSQTLLDFLGQGAISLALSVVLGGLFMSGIYFLIRRLGTLWWLWAGCFTAVSMAAMMLLGPVLIEPLFNQYKPIPAGEVREAVEAMAKQANIPTDRIFVFDGSRQSNNFTANVSGIGSSARIAISDVALTTASLDEVKAVTAHEIGHYVSSHVWRMVGVVVVLSMLFFYVANQIFPWTARLMGSHATLGQPRGIPVLLLIVSVLTLLVEPVKNGFVRMGEMEADNYSLQTVNLPDAMASALVKTAEYRDPRPNAVQEFVFYSHPSVERRVLNTMQWKDAHPQ
jgi:STE24 endopeptidase